MDLAVEQEGATMLRRMLFAASHLPTELPNYWDTVAAFASRGNSVKAEVSTESTRIAMENMHLLHPDAFSSDVELTKELLTIECSITRQALGVPLLSKETKCRSCGGKLLLRSSRPSRMTLYTQSLGSVPATHFHKYCHNYGKGCHLIQFYGYYKSGTGSIHYCDNWMELPYFLSSQETGFELKMLEQFDVELLIGQISYKQKADIYNLTNGYDTTQKQCSSIQKQACPPPVHGAHKQHQEMDRRRFEEAHLKYACLRLAGQYPEAINEEHVTLQADVKDTLEEVMPALFRAFETRYGAHHCSFPGCGSVLVLDGKMKNRRDVCYAKDAGFIEFDGLPGSIKTGCPATPSFKNRFCQNHKNQACEVHEVSSQVVDEGSGASSAAGFLPRKTLSCPGAPVAEMILGRKVTRKQVYYQVLWLSVPGCYATWEPASCLPQHLVEQFEAGLVADVRVETLPLYGHLSSTVTIAQESFDGQREKRMRQERPSVEHLTGAFEELSNQPPLSCRTEKDKTVRLNHRTAGLLAGMWPCGIITLIRELFLAESKAQVYSHVHEFLHTKPDLASSLKYICYDDGCHLLKYAKNPCRSQMTSTTRILSNMSIVIDKMHMAGHVDPWCKKTCDPHLFSDLDKVDTEVCEQVFSWLSRYSKMTTKMNRHTFIFLNLYLCNLHNNREVLKLKRAGFLT